MVTAEELFRGEFDEPKDFYENFTSAVELYYELSNRIVALADSAEATEMSAYSLMYETYMSDMRENGKEGLGALLYLYQTLKREVYG